MTQRAFRIRFALGRRDPVPIPIHNWLSNFGRTGYALNRKSTGRRRTAPGPETGRCESFNWTISEAFCTETRGCPMVIWSKCLENSASRSQDAPIQNVDCRRTERVKEIVKPLQLCVENFRTFSVQLFCCLRARHFSTFQAQSKNKISGTGFPITLRNFTNGHSKVSRLQCGVPFLSLVCWVPTLLKKTMLL
jgi:hypothetical protein